MINDINLDNISKYLKINFLVSTGKTVVISLVTLLLLPLIIQKLGLQLFGIISLTLLFSELSTVVDLGISKSIVLLSGENKLSENEVVTSAFFINLIVIIILSIIFIVLQLFSVDLLGKNLDIPKNEKFILINVGFILLVLTLINNFCRAILESNFLIHIVNVTYTIYTPLLYLVIFMGSFFTKNMQFYVFTPLILTSLMLIFNIIIIKSKTNTQFVKIGIVHLKLVSEKTASFFKIELINSIVIPVLRYSFVLVVADVSLYALFDLSFKIALLANSLIVSISMPMFVVFSKNNKNTRKMINISYKLFWISLGIYVIFLIGFYFIGDAVIQFFDLNTFNSDLLFSITFILLICLGSVAVVEVFYRYFLGNDQLKLAFILKLFIPIVCFIFYLILKDIDLIYRFIYSYGASLIISTLLIIIIFNVQSKAKLKNLL